MDKEAQQKIGNFVEAMVCLSEPIGDMWVSTDAVAEFHKLAEALGYRKLPKDKPPLLSDEELDKLWRFCWGYKHQAKSIAQAQRESDIKWYEEDNKRGGESNEITGKEAQQG